MKIENCELKIWETAPVRECAFKTMRRGDRQRTPEAPVANPPNQKSQI
jgi:hypothetical protein